jgi:hypothetical protein
MDPSSGCDLSADDSDSDEQKRYGTTLTDEDKVKVPTKLMFNQPFMTLTVYKNDYRNTMFWEIINDKRVRRICKDFVEGFRDSSRYTLFKLSYVKTCKFVIKEMKDFRGCNGLLGQGIEHEYDNPGYLIGARVALDMKKMLECKKCMGDTRETFMRLYCPQLTMGGQSPTSFSCIHYEK